MLGGEFHCCFLVWREGCADVVPRGHPQQGGGGTGGYYLVVTKAGAPRAIQLDLLL